MSVVEKHPRVLLTKQLTSDHKTMRKMFSYRTTMILIGILGVLVFSCTTKHTIQEVEDAMKKYDRLILKLDADSIALLYSPDGDIEKMAHGRKAIREFLFSFKNVQVLAQSSIPKSTLLTGETAVQTGNYFQTVCIAKKDTVKITGEYSVLWIWVAGEGWRIKKMNTKPTD